MTHIRPTLGAAATALVGLALGFSDVTAQEPAGADRSRDLRVPEEPGHAVAGRGTEAVDAPRPPFRVALQAGHWRAAEAPDELARLRSNGTRGGGRAEWEVTLEIARLAASLLGDAGFDVEILPTTIPPRYRADLFIAIHADGSPGTSASGFSVAPPRRDATGRAGAFAEVLAESYGEATSLRRRQMTRRMQGYYAFNARRYRHALDPATVAVILETGFLTSPTDRRIIVSNPERPARGIVEAITRFLEAAEDGTSPT